MATRFQFAAMLGAALICAPASYSQTVRGQAGLRARLPFSGVNEPASLQSAMKAQPRPSTAGGWSVRPAWGYGPMPPAPLYGVRAAWLPSPNSIAPVGTVPENWSWMDNWENEQLGRSAAIDESTQAVLDVMSTRPNAAPWLSRDSEWQSINYPISYQANPPIAQPSVDAGTSAASNGSAAETAPSQQLSVPSAATTAPIPY